MDDTSQRTIALIDLMSPKQLRQLELAIQGRLDGFGAAERGSLARMSLWGKKQYHSAS